MAKIASLSENIVGSMEEEKIILIKARVASGAERFAINLACSNKDIAFHFNPRFGESSGVVVCNTCTNARWGKEERTTPMPFQRGEPFEMTIIVKSEHYEVSVNGKHILNYDHRLPYHTVEQLEFRGDVSRKEVSYPAATGKSPQDPQNPPPYSLTPQGDTRTKIGDPKQNKQ